jgi:pimeloyl-ACP methyl ester carboxylesterase
MASSGRRQSCQATLEACVLHHEVAGNGEPLILVHGLTGSTRSWLPSVPHLASRFRVHTVDLAGFGQTRAHEFRLTDAASCLEGFMDQAHIERASLIGHSMGALVAADLAVRTPDRVSRLVLVAPPVGAHRRSIGRHARELASAILAVPLMFVPSLLSDVLRAGPITLWRAARDLLSVKAEPTLAGISAPTLLVWGELDSVVPVSVGRRLERLVPDSRLLVVAGAGHAPMWDQPERFGRAVTRFLTGVDQGTPR